MKQINNPKYATYNGHGGYTVTFENGSTLSVIAFNTEHAVEMVKFNPYYHSVCSERKKKMMSAEEISAIEDSLYMRSCR